MGLPNTNHQPPTTTHSFARRTFLQWSVAAWTLFAAWLAATAWMFVRYMFPNVLYEPESKFAAGRRSDYPESDKVYENFKQSHGVWLVHLTEDGQDRLVALAAVCTHLGCTPNWLAAEQRFKCPCHGTAFHKDGVNFAGPAPRPLERYRICLDAAGNIIVDKSRKYRKELGQCNEPESYLLLSETADARG
jgi:cytochrome b6-f complex iron-sulfur subunit